MSREVTVDEAAKLLGVSRDTIMRRIHKGELEAHQEPRPQGHVWRVTIPDKPADNPLVDALTRELETLRGVVELLKEELAQKNTQIQELHVLLREAQSALPAPRNTQPWWKWWARSS
jgi:excisionase family DNA binding protein